ncbi:MAG: NAD(P)/FAD-dependent oxidoreductase [Cyanobacteria bacterium J06626_14]
MQKYDMIIVGAGMAGLAAASEIYKSNRNIIVLEARDRIGGRLSSERLSDGLLFERGGELIHGTKNAMYSLVNELGIEIRELQKSEVDVGPMESVQLLFVMLLLRFGWYPKPHIHEGITDYLNRLPFFPNSLKVFLDQASKDFEDLDRVSALLMVERMRQQILEGEMYGEHDFVFKDGYITLLNHLAKDLPIAFNHRVHKILWQDEQVVIETDQGVFSAPKIVLTLPIPILKDVNFEPELPEEKQVALSAHVSGDIIKLLVPVQKKAFKTEREEGTIADAKLALMWWRRNSPGDQPNDRQILVGWITGPRARQYVSQSSDDALKTALADLSAVVEIDLIDTAEIIVQNWMEDEFSAGTYCYIKPGYGLHIVDDLARSLHDKLYFAGTATASSTSRGTAHGAYESGLRVAKEVLAI